MIDEFAQRIRAAAIAAWWTVLIAVLLVTVQWVAYLLVLSAKPSWILTLWGPDITWAAVQALWLNMIALVKVCIWIMALLAVWLTLWSRRLRRA